MQLLPEDGAVNIDAAALCKRCIHSRWALRLDTALQQLRVAVCSSTSPQQHPSRTLRPAQAPPAAAPPAPRRPRGSQEGSARGSPARWELPLPRGRSLALPRRVRLSAARERSLIRDRRNQSRRCEGQSAPEPILTRGVRLRPGICFQARPPRGARAPVTLIPRFSGARRRGRERSEAGRGGGTACAGSQVPAGLRRAGSIARGPAFSWYCVRAPRLRLLPPRRGRSRRGRRAGRTVRTRGGPACSRRPAWRRRALKSAAFAAAARVGPGRAAAEHPVRRVRLAGRRSRGAAPCRRGDVAGGAEEEETAPRAPGLSGTRWRGAGWARAAAEGAAHLHLGDAAPRERVRPRPAPPLPASGWPSPPASLLEERSGVAEGWPVGKGRCRFLVPVLFVF